MRKSNQNHSLTAVATFASFVIGFPAAFPQTPAQNPEQTLVQPPAITVPSPPPVTDSAFKPTPKQIGDALMSHQRYQAAIEAYKKASSDSAEVLNQIGIAYQMMFDLNEAIHYYQASLKIDPRNANALNNLGTVYDSLKQYSAAYRTYHKALKIDPRSAIVYKNLGTSLLAQHNFKKGWAAYEAALAIDPQIFKKGNAPSVDNPASVKGRGAVNYYLAKSCVRAGLADRAIEYLRMAINEGFTNPRKIVADSEFASLRGIPAFQQLLASQGNP